METNSGFFSSGRRAVVVGVLAALILLFTAGSFGLTWDEPAYISASTSYAGWFRRLIVGPHGVLNRSVIESHWQITSEAPPFDMEISGLVWLAAHNVVDDLLAHRLANILLAGLAVGLLYHMVRDELGEVAGLGAAVLLLLMPRRTPSRSSPHTRKAGAVQLALPRKSSNRLSAW